MKPEFEVVTPSGSKIQVLNEEEVEYYEDKAKRYLKDNHFTNVTDLQDIDRVLMFELMCWRYGQWLLLEKDYFGEDVDLEMCEKSIRENSKELRLVKKQMGIDKASREKERSESVAEYLEDLRNRAKEFGVMREQQLTKGITLFKELDALVTLHDNCTEDERKEQNVEMHDIFDWLRTVAFPEFNAIDDHFKNNQQKYWVRDI